MQMVFFSGFYPFIVRDAEDVVRRDAEDVVRRDAEDVVPYN